MARTKPSSRSPKTEQNASGSDGRRLKIFGLLDEVAELLKTAPIPDSGALAQIRILQLRVLAPEGEKSSAVPAEAPARWLERKDKSETPIAFIKRIYGPWLGQGISLDIKKLDRSLYLAISKWIYLHEPSPADLDLPTKEQNNSRRLHAVGKISLQLPEDAREIRRLYELARRRKKRRPSSI